jgi:hypothetical protein
MAADVPRSIDRGAEVPTDDRSHMMRFAWHPPAGVARLLRERTPEWLFLRLNFAQGQEQAKDQRTAGGTILKS